MTREIEWFPRTIIFDNYGHSSEYPVVGWALDSVAVATVVTALSVLLGAMARHALARLLLPGLLGVQIVDLLPPHQVPPAESRRARRPA